MMKRIVLLGASGSIGGQALEVMANDRRHFLLEGISIGHQIDKIAKIVELFPSIKAICVQEERDFLVLQKKYPHLSFFYGDQGLLHLIEAIHPQMVINALVGFVGFLPSYWTLKWGIDLALSNKESLVVGGELLLKACKETQARILPIDSEHVALDKCLKGHRHDVKRLVLTASGGAFRNLSRSELLSVTVEDALKHPSWQMGKKITIDCATMMNKGFELIEAYYLFNIPMDRITILMHDESKIHSLIECRDGSFLADIGPSDMRIPIAYALYEKKRKPSLHTPFNFEDFGSFHFRVFSEERYPCVRFAREAIKHGGTMPTVLNAANEEAVYAFLNHQIPFLMIEEIIEKCLQRHRVIDNPDIEDIIYADQMARHEAILLIEEVKKC